MSTGRGYVFSDGAAFASQLDALLHLKRNPTLTVEFSELSMAGVKTTDVTEKFRSILNDHPYGTARDA